MLLGLVNPTAPLVSAVAAGALTCVALRGRHIRGDHTLLASTLASGVLYWLVRKQSESPLLATTAIISTYLLTALTITALYRLSPFHPLASYPGPRIAKLTSLWLSYISSTGKRYEIIDALHEKHGPFLRIGPSHLSINSASATSLYLNTEKSESYRHPGHNGHVALFFKQDTVEQHRTRKRVWGGFFTPKRYYIPARCLGLIPQLDRRTWELIGTLERRQSQNPEGVVNLVDTMYHWSHDFMGDMVFGGCNALELMKNGDPDGIVNTGKIALGQMDCIGQTPWLLDILWHVPATRRMHTLEDLAAQMMRARVQSKDLPEHRDLSSYLLEAEVPLHELETDAVVAIMGGSDNTSITTSLAIFYLLWNRQYYDRLREELFTAFPDPMCSLQMDELAALPFLNGVINETLRLASPYYNPRVVPPGGTTVDGKYIPEGTIVAIAAHSVQTSPENFFPAPKEFHPQRWLPQGLGPQTITNKAVLSSFSFGPYYCIGKNLAYHQMRYALTRLILAFDLEFEKGFDPVAFKDGILNMRTMFLKRELRVRVTRRPGVDLEKLVF
ncbi:cytochrome P450 [Trametes punicea]|nr:cytochrome P450 [Trametes punicea]